MTPALPTSPFASVGALLASPRGPELLSRAPKAQADVVLEIAALLAPPAAAATQRTPAELLDDLAGEIGARRLPDRVSAIDAVRAKLTEKRHSSHASAVVARFLESRDERDNFEALALVDALVRLIEAV